MKRTLSGLGAAIAVLACGSTGPTPAPLAGDSVVDVAPAGDTPGDDSGEDAARPSVFDALPAAGTAITWEAHVQPILRAYCAGCHTALGDEKACLGAKCFAEDWTVTHLPGCCAADSPFATCKGAGATVTTILAECMLRRVEETRAGGARGALLDSLGPILVSDVDTAVLRAWVEAGAPGPAAAPSGAPRTP